MLRKSESGTSVGSYNKMEENKYRGKKKMR
jgi:hypothetical protein